MNDEGKITKFYPKDAAKNPDAVLEQAIGCYDKVLVLGWDADGNLDARASTNASKKDLLWMIEGFKLDLFCVIEESE